MAPSRAYRSWSLAGLSLLAVSRRAVADDAPLPVVIWHGMGDNCCNSFSMGAVKNRIEQVLPGTYVYSVMVGKDPNEDTEHGYFGNVNQQVAAVCDALSADPQLAQGYNAVGFSQGSQFLRAVAERCPAPPMRNLVTLGGQHQGVSALPGCNVSSPDAAACLRASDFVARDVYAPWVKDNIVQAQYFKDPKQLDRYLSRNPFLPDINNEGERRNPKYAANLRALSRLVLFMFENDVTVQPKESSWFGFWDGDAVVPLRQQRGYREDWLGLRSLDKAGRLELATVPGAAHMQFTLDWFEENVIRPYLAGSAAAAVAAAEPAADVMAAEAAEKKEKEHGAAGAGAGEVLELIGGEGTLGGGAGAAVAEARRRRALLLRR